MKKIQRFPIVNEFLTVPSTKIRTYLNFHPASTGLTQKEK